MLSAEALRRARLTPLELEAKEGLALLNGTQAMHAVGGLALLRAQRLACLADVAGAMTLEALKGTPAAFDLRLQNARPHPGQKVVAEHLLSLMHGSEIRQSHLTDDPRVQDAYSLRCMPQVHGAVRDALAQIRATIVIELNSATDNPLVFAGGGGAGEVISGGNFHGQPLAMAADQLAVALATLAGISERRTEQLTNPQGSELPAFLVREAGLNSGFMILQVTAAALAAEMKALATPHSIGSIPTSANQEDYVSMGMAAARRIQPMLANLRNVLAIEMLAGCQGLDLLAPLRTGPETQKAYEMLRATSKKVDADRSLSRDIEAVAARIAAGEFSKLLS